VIGAEDEIIGTPGKTKLANLAAAQCQAGSPDAKACPAKFVAFEPVKQPLRL
jgi:hypothetical protein